MSTTSVLEKDIAGRTLIWMNVDLVLGVWLSWNVCLVEMRLIEMWLECLFGGVVYGSECVIGSLYSLKVLYIMMLVFLFDLCIV